MALKSAACPCGGVDYDACCGRYHSDAPAPDAVSLMRSRYSAYVLKLADYLLATWHPDTRPATLEMTDEKWLGLQIKGWDTEAGTVEFVARYKIAGRAYRLHEISRFTQEDGRWYYTDGSFPEHNA